MDVIVTLGIGLDHYTVQDAHGVSMGGDCGIQLIVHLSFFSNKCVRSVFSLDRVTRPNKYLDRLV
jgi:hypothetical protein